MINIPFRNDQYGKSFYIKDCNGIQTIPYHVGEYVHDGIVFNVKESIVNDVLKINITIRSNDTIPVDCLGFRLGIDTYMDCFPDWNNKYVPSAMRCEQNGFWSCFMSPLGKFISVCSPSKIVSWRNEYSQADYDLVGHRIYTSCIEFINTSPQPQRHCKSNDCIGPAPIEIELYYAAPNSKEEMFAFIEKYSGIKIPTVNKYTLEPGEKLIIDNGEYHGTLHDGMNWIRNKGCAELSIYVRKPWFYYLDCARQSAEKCQQKPGTHCESWYGFFSRVLYANEIKDACYTKQLCDDFEEFFSVIAENTNGSYMLKEGACPERVQNTSTMISLLSDFYTLTKNTIYLDRAHDFSSFLITLQSDDGSYRCGNVHYTCVIYPAKSILELALVEKEAGLEDRYIAHFNSAYRAIKNLELLLDNIETEGEMTFEDGMISCESLQLAYLALQLPDGDEKLQLIHAAEYVLAKHQCLEQHFLPDCRVRGCTLRYWEARYDLNFFSNMINSPHGWTSWKTYATYYLYMLTGKLSYLKDTMDTIGACMQCVDHEGNLNWGFVLDPCISGKCLSQESTRGNIVTKEVVVGESYLPTISQWWRQDEHQLVGQYLAPWDEPDKWDENFGGSCDNDVHEHFKCLMETVFGKAFIHETKTGFEIYNCSYGSQGFTSTDSHLKQWIVFNESNQEICLNGKLYNLKKGFNLFHENK